MPFHAWLTHSLVRHFPRATPAAATKKTIRLDAARGERASFQAAFVFDDRNSLIVTAKSETTGGLVATVRRIGHVPLPHFNTDVPDDHRDGIGHLPGLVPDILHPEAVGHFAARETNAFWVTIDIPKSTRPGKHAVTIELTADKYEPVKLTAHVEVADVVARPLKNFVVTHWFYADAIADWYKVEPFSDAFWPMLDKFVANYAKHGNNCIYVPTFTPPLDGVKRPTQLVIVKEPKKGKYTFDFSLVKKWIEIAQSHGITNWEWCHPFTQWGVKNAIRIYRNNADPTSLLWPVETGATSDIYRNFLSQYIPELRKFIDANGLLKGSYFHVSDEPHGDEALTNYRAARGLIQELAPWMKIMDAISEIRFAKEGLIDTPIPVVSSVKEFMDAKIDCFTYYCCSPRGKFVNRLLDTPLPKVRAQGWLFHKLKMGGFLHWGYNYWYQRQTQNMLDPFLQTDGGRWPGWAFGDPFIVYPGPADIGPIDSLRWEVFAESLQDQALLQTLGIKPDDRRLAPLKAFDDFPLDAEWTLNLRRKLLK